MARPTRFPIPRVLPASCASCGGRLHWVPVSYFDPIVRLEKVDHYKSKCAACGAEYFYDGRGQPVEPATLNVPPENTFSG